MNDAAAPATTSGAIGVVVPYYQREPGILDRALASIRAQRELSSHLDVVVVDDGSPVPAEPSLESIGADGRVRVRLLRQANGGPAAARNAGLRALGPECALVAFLDSDDTWDPLHLERAVSALDHGDDVYFANYVNIGKDASAYDIEGRIRTAEHACLDASRAIHRYGGDMVDQIVRGNLIFASTLVYRRDRYPDLVFRDDYVHAGEDYLFFLDLATRGASFVFSMQVGARLGVGVNIYAGSGWGTDTHFARLYYEMKYRQASLALYPLDAAQRRFVHEQLTGLRVSALRDLLHRTRHGKPLDWSRLRALLALDKAYPLRLPWLAWRMLRRSPAAAERA